MDVIALSGNSCVGKTSTLNILYSLMLNDGYVQVLGHFDNHKHNDFIDILEKEGTKIGIATQGDYPKALSKHLKYLALNGCHKSICACTTRGWGTRKAVKAYPNTFITKKVEIVDSLQRIVNTDDANNIKTLI